MSILSEKIFQTQKMFLEAQKKMGELKLQEILKLIEEKKYDELKEYELYRDDRVINELVERLENAGLKDVYSEGNAYILEEIEGYDDKSQLKNAYGNPENRIVMIKIDNQVIGFNPWGHIDVDPVSEYERALKYFEEHPEDRFSTSDSKEAQKRVIGLDNINLEVLVKNAEEKVLEKDYENDKDGFEINKFGEIIRFKSEELTSKLKEEIILEELQKVIDENDKTITNNEQSIKQALVQRILEQQKIIAEQQTEIDSLKSQKEL